MDVLDVFELYSDASESKLKNFEKKLSSNMDVKIETEKPKTELRWMTMMEDTMVYINNILNAPTRLIINEEEVVKIEKIKKVTVESIKHLSRNAGFIEDARDKGHWGTGDLRIMVRNTEDFEKAISTNFDYYKDSRINELKSLNLYTKSIRFLVNLSISVKYRYFL